ncbi:hypothetical protein CLTEP_25780 [Clostridium tepidiprofundi DSM 19306]|uniref:Uncharacterized protein n=1 Tax=Clostridium tepidiprofundi DSM 19306 TaxID=1121338 RepID=A0A151ASD9_9CLOT|nr:hypothetical protein [Clostridium tepidiprofundi]KYH30568.1 hypothetical protein CLTEP_25780 [Clostridium tepidiprofundi DSM 19306]
MKKTVIILLSIAMSIIILNTFLSHTFIINYTQKSFLYKKLDTVKINKTEKIMYKHTIDDITQKLYYNTINRVDYVSSYITIKNINYFLGSSLYNKQIKDLSRLRLLVTKTNLNYKSSVYKFVEVMGANYAKTTYFIVVNKTPKILISMDGYTYEKDIDNDGKLETISVYSSPGEQTTIYKWNFKNGNISYVNLNETIFDGSPSVHINDKSQIVVYIHGKKEYYIIRNSKIHKI